MSKKHRGKTAAKRTPGRATSPGEARDEWIRTARRHELIEAAFARAQGVLGSLEVLVTQARWRVRAWRSTNDGDPKPPWVGPQERDDDLGPTYASALVNWDALRSLAYSPAWSAVEETLARVYDADAAPVKLGKLPAHPTLLAVVGEELGVWMRNLIFMGLPTSMLEPEETESDAWLRLSRAWGQVEQRKQWSAINDLSEFPLACDELLVRLTREHAKAKALCGDDADAPDPTFVTLDQAAAVAHKGKRTLERWLSKGELPPPDVRGGTGKASTWRWSTLREPLQERTGHELPRRFPAGRVF